MLFVLKPDLVVASVEQLDPVKLRKAGVKSILSDLDNTLAAYHSDGPSDSVLRWLNRLRDEGIQIAVLSNAPRKRIEPVCRRLSLPLVPEARKPFSGGFRKAMALIGAEPDSTLVVGDQIFTDVLGANLQGLAVAIVEPLYNKHFYALRRFIEGRYRR